MRHIALGLGINLLLATTLSLAPAAFRRSPQERFGEGALFETNSTGNAGGAITMPGALIMPTATSAVTPITTPPATAAATALSRTNASRSPFGGGGTMPSDSIHQNSGIHQKALPQALASPGQSNHLPTDSMAMAPSAAFAASATNAEGSTAGRAAFTSTPDGNGIASAAALANLAGAESLPHRSVAPLSAPPDKGVEVFVQGAWLNATQAADGKNTSNLYSMRNQTYRLGVRKDISVNSVAGLSADMFKARVESAAENDNRRSDIDGFSVGASYEYLLFGSFPTKARAFYGTAETTGGGKYQTAPGPISYDWSEEKYRSTLYGAALGVGAPFILGRDVRVIPEFGLEYAVVDNAAHWANPAEYWPDIAIPRHRAASLSLPVTLRLQKDFLPCWGLFTVRLGGGYARELLTGGESVRTLGASAAGGIFPAPFGGPAEAILYRNGPKNFYRLDAGFDLFANNGWKVAADYSRRMATGYHSDVLTLELGKCF